MPIKARATEQPSPSPRPQHPSPGLQFTLWPRLAAQCWGHRLYHHVQLLFSLAARIGVSSTGSISSSVTSVLTALSWLSFHRKHESSGRIASHETKQCPSGYLAGSLTIIKLLLFYWCHYWTFKLLLCNKALFVASHWKTDTPFFVVLHLEMNLEVLSQRPAVGPDRLEEGLFLQVLGMLF